MIKGSISRHATLAISLLLSVLLLLSVGIELIYKMSLVKITAGFGEVDLFFRHLYHEEDNKCRWSFISESFDQQRLKMVVRRIEEENPSVAYSFSTPYHDCTTFICVHFMRMSKSFYLSKLSLYFCLTRI